ncbi:hypothetical protein [Pseudomonas viridiflava]|jgi:hypothetical protein|uniref:hypothetical protein n=1 Tax=Pseudomonas viridiflava TaxID=33069 RepID=UPI000F03814E|nr:hypothetical protein [Pseudomonas viridiflava]MEE4137858.1 hypothetical protein [Pseudomonas viridiflava]
MYHYIEPEVAGELGNNTRIITSCHPPKVTKLEYKFNGWLGDDLLESFPCFIVSRKLADALSKKKLSGYYFTPMTTSKSEIFKELQPQTDLPEFQWLQVSGSAGRDDFGLAKNHLLVISDIALETLNMHNINQAEIYPYLNN